ncbi:MAG: N-formylglutamate amidohydrolase [Burkholderiales bacterium]|nr:MAG: N-formylglutamate amidohydrolase [Burkholderiales bacterium]
MTQLVTSHPGNSPLVLDSPHSGTYYPPDFGFVCDLARLRTAEDTHVEKLYGFARELGCAWIEAHFPRSYLDANRNLTEVDPDMLSGAWPHSVEMSDPYVLSKRRLGKGLIWRATDEGEPLYQRQLSVREVEKRIDHCWKPYHAAVKAAIDSAHARHGYSLHINCHSMPEVAGSHATDFPGVKHPDFVLGNRDHSTSNEAVLLFIREQLVQMGYSVSLNHPYKGVELVRRYGEPAQHRHSVQIEINRGLYMNEKTLEITDGFAPLRENLKQLVLSLQSFDPR